jgi:hypothetical protein
MTAMPHPALAWSSDISRLFVVYSGLHLDTSVYGFNMNDIYLQYCEDNGEDTLLVFDVTGRLVAALVNMNT